MKNVVHARKIGEDKDGKGQYINTIMGCIMQNEDGRAILKLNYTPLEENPILNLYDPKKKKEDVPLF